VNASYYQRNKARTLARISARRKTPNGAYAEQMSHAKRRGIEWTLTFDEWWALWEPLWAERGRGKLRMCRIKEPGPYAKDNVYIGDARSNAEDRYRNKNVVAKRRRL
jgi:hypothetical protein